MADEWAAVVPVAAPNAVAAAASAAAANAAAAFQAQQQSVPFADHRAMQAAAAAAVVLTPEQEAKLNEQLEVKLGLLWASASWSRRGDEASSPEQQPPLCDCRAIPYLSFAYTMTSVRFQQQRARFPPLPHTPICGGCAPIPRHCADGASRGDEQACDWREERLQAPQRSPSREDQASADTAPLRWPLAASLATGRFVDHWPLLESQSAAFAGRSSEPQTAPRVWLGSDPAHSVRSCGGCRRRIMKSDEDVRMISAEAPILFAKACEMFIL